MVKYILIPLLALSFTAQAEVYDRIMAIVNGEILTKSDFDSFKKRVKNQKLADDLFNVDYKKLQNNDKLLLSHLIDQKIVDSEVSRLALNATPERVAAEIQKIAAGLGASESDLRKRLKADGIDFTEYRQFIKTRIERQALIQREITSKIRISDDELKSHYARQSKNPEVDVFEYNLSHILFKVKDSETEAKSKAADVFARIKKGLNFSDAASQYSEDPNFTTGGFLGKFKSGEFLPVFENAVRNLDEGQVAKPVKVADNYIILRVNKKQIAESAAFLQQKERIRAQLTQEAFKKQFQFWLVQKRTQADVKMN